MNDFVPLTDYDYTFLGVKPQDWIEDYVCDLDEDELDNEAMLEIIEEEEV